jgi:hypothetical protein
MGKTTIGCPFPPRLDICSAACASGPLKLSKFTEQDILRLHGMGPSSVPRLKAALLREGLSLQVPRQPMADSAFKGRRAKRARP